MKELFKDLFEKCGITDVKIVDDFINKMFESKVLMELIPEITIDIQKIQVVERGNRGCLIFDGRYFYILPYQGKVFDLNTDKLIAQEDFTKFENNEEI